MCLHCTDLLTIVESKGYTEEEALDYLWEHTPFPVDHPNGEQKELAKQLAHKV